MSPFSKGGGRLSHRFPKFAIGRAHAELARLSLARLGATIAPKAIQVRIWSFGPVTVETALGQDVYQEQVVGGFFPSTVVLPLPEQTLSDFIVRSATRLPCIYWSSILQSGHNLELSGMFGLVKKKGAQKYFFRDSFYPISLIYLYYVLRSFLLSPKIMGVWILSNIRMALSRKEKLSRLSNGSKGGLSPKQLVSTSQLATFVRQEKVELRERLEENTIFPIAGRLMFSSTSGSSGVPLRFYRGRDHEKIHAICNLMAGQYGLDLAGIDVPANKARWLHLSIRSIRTPWRPLKNGDIEISVDYLGNPEVLGLVNSFQPHIVQGLPSLLKAFAENLDGAVRLPVAVGRSETLLPTDLPALDKTFCNLVMTYGQSEAVGFALRCPTCGMYSQVPLYGYFHRHNTEISQTYDVSGTAFRGRGTQFFNYAVGDLFSFADEARCKDCPNHSLPLGYFEGRHRELLTDRRGTLVSAKSLLAWADTNLLAEIAAWVIQQDSPGFAIFIYKPRPGFQVDEARLISGLNELAFGISWECEQNEDLLKAITTRKRKLVINAKDRGGG